MRKGVRLAVDVGTRRVGIARSDHDGILALPVETCERERALTRLAELVAEYAPVEIVCGLPVALSGRETSSTEDAREFARELALAAGTAVRLVDERLSTVSAHEALRGSGSPTREHKSRVDQVAAVILLQHALDSERMQSVPPGQVLE